LKKKVWLFHKFAGRKTSDVIWVSIGIFLTYLFMHSLLLLFIYRQIIKSLPSDFADQYIPFFSLSYISAMTGLVFSEILVFLFGWLFISVAVVLLDGKQNTRLLFGWLGICYSPLLCYSFMIFGLILFNPDFMDFTPLASISTIEQVSEKIIDLSASAPEGLKWLPLGRVLGIMLTLILAFEVVHRICMVPRSKAIGIILTYATLQGFTHLYFT